ARLYEVVSEETAEESVSRRRKKSPKKSSSHPVVPFTKNQPQQYELDVSDPIELRAAESGTPWDVQPSDD
ncbi:MAG: hypothetical protein AAF327_24115, partial [Cyanobacteria bacterium P01_A01_bin.37]